MYCYRLLPVSAIRSGTKGRRAWGSFTPSLYVVLHTSAYIHLDDDVQKRSLFTRTDKKTAVITIDRVGTVFFSESLYNVIVNLRIRFRRRHWAAALATYTRSRSLVLSPERHRSHRLALDFPGRRWLPGWPAMWTAHKRYRRRAVGRPIGPPSSRPSRDSLSTLDASRITTTVIIIIILMLHNRLLLLLSSSSSRVETEYSACRICGVRKYLKKKLP